MAGLYTTLCKPCLLYTSGRLVGKYIAKRILSGVITIVILITACFFLMHAIPGSPFSKGEQGVPEAVMQRLNEK